MKTLPEVTEAIRGWANDRNIIKGSDPYAQFRKLVSEFGEFGGHLYDLMSHIELGEHNLAKQLVDKIQDDIGDNYVVLTILCAQKGYAADGFMLFQPVAVSNAPYAEYLLLARSYGKMADAISKNDEEGFVCEMRTSLRLLFQVANKVGMGLYSCALAAYNDIKDRKGVMFNGTFIKESDELYEAAVKVLQEGKE